MLLLAAMSPDAGAKAVDDDGCPVDRGFPATVNFRVDNDLFGGQDQGYSNGAQLTLVSPNLKSYVDDPCLSPTVRWLNRHLDWLAPQGFPQQNMVFTVAHAIYTPADPRRRDLITDDRPYAAALLFGVGYNARNADTLHTTQLKLGLVGPSARGRQVQNSVHKILGDQSFEGWDNQLRDEPVFMLQHERMRRIAGKFGNGWGWDAIGHYGAAVGNFATFANAGYQLRFGRHLPNDFGSAPLRPAGENTAPDGDGDGVQANTWRHHLFVTMDVRWVLRDITLDGNTWKSSHSVDKKPLVGYVGYGFAVMHGPWKFALARYHSSRQFYGQQERPVFGSFTISYSFSPKYMP
ncbi:MAG: lipid A deacylase LpxR family protein [Burkholderiaceae bacterium]